MRRVLMIIGCAVALAGISIMIAVPLLNDLTAKETAEKLADTPLPEQTEYIESVYRAGKQAGNGNGMQYFGEILIKSELPLESLTEYYKSYATNNWEYITERQADKSITAIEIGQLSFISDITSDDFFIVYSWGASCSFFADLDIRGH